MMLARVAMIVAVAVILPAAANAQIAPEWIEVVEAGNGDMWSMAIATIRKLESEGRVEYWTRTDLAEPIDTGVGEHDSVVILWIADCEARRTAITHIVQYRHADVVWIGSDDRPNFNPVIPDSISAILLAVACRLLDKEGT